MDGADWGIVGHERQVERLERAVERGSVTHAYLIAGPPRVGKTALALALARRLVCLGEPKPCGQCRPCRTVESGSFPDVTLVRPLVDTLADDEGAESKKRIITIDQIRELRRAANLSPYEAARKLYILVDADTMEERAADALLKTLEEPPASAVLILTARDTGALPPTVASRCQLVPLRPVPAPILAAALAARGVEAEAAAQIARLAQGRPGWAIEAARDPGLIARRETALGEWLALLDAGSPARLGAVPALEKAFKADRPAFEETMDLWLGLWRDLWLLKTGCAELIVNAEQRETLARQAGRFSLAVIAGYGEAILGTLRLLAENAQPRLALESLLIRIPEPADASAAAGRGAL